MSKSAAQLLYGPVLVLPLSLSLALSLNGQIIRDSQLERWVNKRIKWTKSQIQKSLAFCLNFVFCVRPGGDLGKLPVHGEHSSIGSENKRLALKFVSRF